MQPGQITAHLRAHSSFAIVDLRPVFAEAAKSGPIYHATDSHWNEIGGYLGYCAMLDGWRQQGVAILMATHDPALRQQLADRALTLQDGLLEPIE